MQLIERANNPVKLHDDFKIQLRKLLKLELKLDDGLKKEIKTFLKTSINKEIFQIPETKYNRNDLKIILTTLVSPSTHSLSLQGSLHSKKKSTPR